MTSHIEYLTQPLWFASEAAKAQQLPKQAAEAQPPKLIEGTTLCLAFKTGEFGRLVTALA